MLIRASLAALLLCTGVQAQERKAYRYTDDSGRVMYSQMPPADGREAGKVSIAPAMAGRGGYSGGPHAPWEDPRYYAAQRGQPQYALNTRDSTAWQQRQAALKAECERQRNTNCSNPATLRDIDSLSIPRRGPYHRPYRG